MTAYLIRRTFQMLLVLLVSSVAIYGILNFAPGGPLSGLRLATGKERISERDLERMRHILGLDKPLHVRYLRWLVGDTWMGILNPDWAGDDKGVVRLDFGNSWRVATGQPVSFLIKSRLLNTLLLMTASTLLSLLVAIPIGLYSAVKQYSLGDYIFTFFTFIGIAIPVFWFGLMMVILFSFKFREWGLPYFPPGNATSVRPPQPGSVLAILGAQPGNWMDRAVHLVMPTIVLSLLYMASWGRYMRSSMLEVLRQDYVRTARAKGLVERLVITRHAMRNALIPLVTIVTLQIPSIFSGAIVTETVFAYPGMGRLYIDALFQADYPVVQALLVITAVLVVFATLLADILYTVVDPRIRFD